MSSVRNRRLGCLNKWFRIGPRRNRYDFRFGYVVPSAGKVRKSLRVANDFVRARIDPSFDETFQSYADPWFFSAADSSAHGP